MPPKGRGTPKGKVVIKGRKYPKCKVCRKAKSPNVPVVWMGKVPERAGYLEG